MIIKIDFVDFVQFIKCSSKVGRKSKRLNEEFVDWVHNSAKYWNAEADCTVYGVEALVEWLNNYRFKKGIAKAKLLKQVDTLKVRKTMRF